MQRVHLIQFPISSYVLFEMEAYKKNMFRLLGKPGYEDAKAALEAKLG